MDTRAASLSNINIHIVENLYDLVGTSVSIRIAHLRYKV